MLTPLSHKTLDIVKSQITESLYSSINTFCQFKKPKVTVAKSI